MPGPPLSTTFVRAFGAFVAVWTLAWIGAGIWTRHEVATLRSLSTTVVTSGGAVRETGDALQGLGRIPFVGGDVARIGRRVSLAGVQAQVSGRESRGAVGDLATLLGLSVALGPSIPMVAVYAVTRRLAARTRVGP